MANFIKQTRLLQTDAEAPVEVKLIPGAVTDVQEALDYQDPNELLTSDTQSRGVLTNLETDPGAYELQYDLQVYYKVEVKGITDIGNHLVVWYYMWPDKASFDAGEEPIHKNSHIMGLRDWGNLDEQIIENIEYYITHASLRDLEGDQIDYTIPLKPLDRYPDSQYNIQKILDLHNLEVEKV